MPLRRVPVTVKEGLKNKLNELEVKGIISNLHNLVVLEKKDGSLRVYLDP